jgi:O-antigen/teichoic acid export membrane protein
VAITYGYYSIVLILGIAVSVVSIYGLRLFISTSYNEAQYYIPWVTMGYAARAMYTMVFPYLVFTGKTNFLAFAAIISAAVNLVGNYVLITLNGAVGAAQSTLLTYLLWFIMIWWYAQRIHPMPWGLGWLRKKGA